MPRTAPPRDAFLDIWESVQHIPGWLTQEQAEVLFDAVRALPPRSTVVEIGSHFGRSTTVLASGRRDVEIVAIDPFLTTGRYPGPAARHEFEMNLTGLGLRERVTLVVSRSQSIRPGWDREIELLWIDGKHDAWSARDDLRWAEHLPDGGVVLIHDAFSSLGVTAALYAQLFGPLRLRYECRVGSLAVLRKVPSGSRGGARMLRETPWWVRNLTVKVALRLRCRQVAHLMGHYDAADPF